MKSQLNIRLLLISVLAIGLIASAATVQAQTQRMAPLAPLKKALQAAGASELSSEQESDIRALILEFRNAHRRPGQDGDGQNARKAYEEAILNGDSAGAAAQAEIIAQAQFDNAVQHQTDAAAFAVDVIGILRADSGQADVLITQMGTRGFVRLILSLVGRPDGPGPMGRPGGPPPRADRPFGQEVPIP